jgi:hypothetical protein
VGRLPQKTKKFASFHFIDAPHQLSLEPGDEIATRTWFHRHQNEIDHISLNESLDYIEEVWNKDGPFDGLLGFSMGGSIVALMTTMPHRFPNIKCVIIGGARNILLDHYCELINIPSLHIMGSKDAVVPCDSSRELSAKFRSPHIIQHDQGHCIPSKATMLDEYSAFLKGVYEDLKVNSKSENVESTIQDSKISMEPLKTSHEATLTKIGHTSNDNNIASHYSICQTEDDATAQRDEMEVLCSMYSDEIRILCDPPSHAGAPCGAFTILLPVPSEDTIHSRWNGQIYLKFTYPSVYPGGNYPPIVELLTGNLPMLEFTNAHRGTLLRIVREICVHECITLKSPCILPCYLAAMEWLMNGCPINNGVDLSDQSSNVIENVIENVNSSVNVNEELVSQQDLDMAHRSTLEAYAVSTREKQMAKIESNRESDNSAVLSASARGIWPYTVGLVGKPSAGKSTFYNAVTRSAMNRDGRLMAEVAPHPFTTIEPNIGPGWYTSFQNDILIDQTTSDPKKCVRYQGAKYGRDSTTHRRLLPIMVKDVAGLVPGAYKGRGKGNRFLADLCDADVLVHVVDVTGKADKDGNAVLSDDVGSTPAEDAEWIRQELHLWIYGNIKAKWSSVGRKGENNCLSRVVALFSGYQGTRAHIETAARRANLNLDSAVLFSDYEIHLLVANYLAVRFPICLALNKIDEDIDRIRGVVEICQMQALERGEIAVPVSARAESWIWQKCSGKNIPPEKSKEWNTEETILQTVLREWQSTGVMEAISAAVKLNPPVLVYPVSDLETELPVGWTSSMSLTTERINSPIGKSDIDSNDNSKTTHSVQLQDCLQFKPGSNVEDVYDALKRGVLEHVTITGDFVRAEGKSIDNKIERHLLRRETIINCTNNILKIQTNRKSVWQADFAHGKKS